MAWNKTAWDNVIGTYASKTNILAGNSASGLIDCNLSSPVKYLDVSIKINVVFGDSPDSNPVIKIFGQDVNGANEQDTIPIYNQEIEYQASQTVIETLPNIDVSAIDNLAIEVLNENGTQDIDVWVSFMAGHIGIDEVYNYSEDTVTGTNTDFAEVYSYTPSLVAGDYIVQWFAEVSNSSNNRDTLWEFIIDDVTVQNKGEYKHGNASGFLPIAAAFPYNAPTLQTVKFSISIATSHVSGEAAIRRIMVIVKKRS